MEAAAGLLLVALIERMRPCLAGLRRMHAGFHTTRRPPTWWPNCCSSWLVGAARGQRVVPARLVPATMRGGARTAQGVSGAGSRAAVGAGQQAGRLHSCRLVLALGSGAAAAAAAPPPSCQWCASAKARAKALSQQPLQARWRPLLRGSLSARTRWRRRP